MSEVFAATVAVVLLGCGGDAGGSGQDDEAASRADDAMGAAGGGGTDAEGTSPSSGEESDGSEPAATVAPVSRPIATLSPSLMSCDGVACGAPCACAVGLDCLVIGALPGVCDVAGNCVPGPVACGDADAYDPCAGKVDGDPCSLCPPNATDCLETAELKSCQAGECQSGEPAPRR